MRKTTMFCDRCLRKIEDSEKYFSQMLVSDDVDDVGRFDMCENCYNDFKNRFMTEIKGKYMAEPDPDDQPCPPMPKGEDE